MLATELSHHPTVEEVAAITGSQTSLVSQFEQLAIHCLHELLDVPPSGMHPLLAHWWVTSTDHSNSRAKEDSASYLSFVRNRAKMQANRGNPWGLRMIRIFTCLEERGHTPIKNQAV